MAEVRAGCHHCQGAVCMWPCPGGLGTLLTAGCSDEEHPQVLYGQTYGWGQQVSGLLNHGFFKGDLWGCFHPGFSVSFFKNPLPICLVDSCTQESVLYSSHLSSPWSVSNNSLCIRSGKTTTELLKCLRSSTNFSWMT